jgi:response regulator RpfG family c-di-GMP phosphodiesterase
MRDRQTAANARYELLARELEQQIAAGVLRPGDHLPSVRQACASRGQSPSTVFQACYLLGVTLLAHARDLDPRTVRMMLSAATEFSAAVAAVNRAGVFRCIPQPWSEPQLPADLRAALECDPCATLGAGELERRRLEALEPGITQVDWGPNGEVLMPGQLVTRRSKL